MKSVKRQMWWVALYPIVIIVMTFFNIGSLNINGCRSIVKRNDLFNYLILKKADVILLQETHTDLQNQSQWLSDWKGNVCLSHGTNVSAGVAVLFSPRVGGNFKSIEIIPGRILRVDVTLGDNVFSLFNVYAPNDGRERITFFEKLSDVLSHCPQDNIIILGGDFNCTLNQQLDRNHNEPHSLSANTLKRIVDQYNFVDLWRDTFPGLRQYTWMKVNSNNMSGARLDRFYTEARNRARFFRNSISPTFLSDHHYISMAISVESTKSYKSLWHFDNRLLQDHVFIHSFHLFWDSWREERVNFQSLSQWWDVGKIQIRIFCQQFTAHSRGALLEKMKALEEEILGQSSQSTTSSTSTDSFERNKFLLRNLAEEQGKTALLRAKFTRLNDMDSPTAFFFGLEKKNNSTQASSSTETPRWTSIDNTNRN